MWPQKPGCGLYKSPEIGRNFDLMNNLDILGEKYKFMSILSQVSHLTAENEFSSNGLNTILAHYYFNICNAAQI